MQSVINADGATEQQPQYFTQPCGPWNGMGPWDATQPVGIMQFSAANSSTDTLHHSKLLQKRKSDERSYIAPKQFITEDKIAAHFNGLHISGNYNQKFTSIQGGLDSDDTPSTSAGKQDTNPAYQLAAKELEEKLRNANRIVLCDELQKFHEMQQKCAPIPGALFNFIQKPCTALVLWQPPPIDRDLVLNEQQSTSKFSARVERSFHCSSALEDDVDDYSDGEIDDYVDNNNTSNLDFNNFKSDCMDEDL